MSKYTAELVRDWHRAKAECIRNGMSTGNATVHDRMADAIDAILRERESAKAGVTDEMTEAACRAYAIASDNPWPYSKEGWNDDDRAYMRAALKVVAQMLASARVPEEWLPIESAPKNEDVLTWADTIIPYNIEYMDDDGNWERNDPKPTHWMPIPKGPKPEKE